MDDTRSSGNVYPVDMVVEYPERSSRLLALAGLLVLLKLLLLLPHVVLLSILSMAAPIIALIGYLAVLVIGRYPRSLFDLQVGLLRWSTRVNAYFMSLTDRYPPFSLT